MMIFCCPACGSALEREDRALRCANGHSYDIARQGYVHLLPVKQMHAKIPGDTKQMVDARRVFLSGGYYDAFRDKLAEADGQISARERRCFGRRLRRGLLHFGFI